jgi:hypothetical protein
MGHDLIGMEQYLAEGSKPVDRCKEDVRAAAYLIIVAWRFGYGPGRTSSGSERALSPNLSLLTARELDHSVLDKLTNCPHFLRGRNPVDEHMTVLRHPSR